MRKLRYIARVALVGHLCNWPWRSRLERRRVRGRVIREAAMQYLKPYAAAVRDVPEDTPAHAEPRRIFSLWLQGQEQAPPLVHACLDSIRRQAGVELVVLDGNTVFDWISLPEAVVRKWRSGKMKAAHFADICRVELLYRYGGVWMDATDYLDAPLPECLTVNSLWFQRIRVNHFEHRTGLIQSDLIPVMHAWHIRYVRHMNRPTTITLTFDAVCGYG